LEEQKQLLLNTGIYTQQDLSGWKEINYNNFYEIVSLNNIDSYDTIQAELRKLLNNFKNAILENNTQKIQSYKK
jgi:hypothetical protein